MTLERAPRAGETLEIAVRLRASFGAVFRFDGEVHGEDEVLARGSVLVRKGEARRWSSHERQGRAEGRPHDPAHLRNPRARRRHAGPAGAVREDRGSRADGALILDLSGLEHLDSTAIGVLVGGLKRFEAQGRRFYLVNPRERVASVFRITHLDSVFRIFPTVEAAVKAADLAGEEATSEH